LSFRGGHDSRAGKAATSVAEIVQENQAVKRQKLDDGNARQVRE
jgi:targeting protein for Xklp2